jgi:hypothetical protein
MRTFEIPGAALCIADLHGNVPLLRIIPYTLFEKEVSHMKGLPAEVVLHEKLEDTAVPAGRLAYDSDVSDRTNMIRAILLRDVGGAMVTPY